MLESRGGDLEAQVPVADGPVFLHRFFRFPVPAAFVRPMVDSVGTIPFSFAADRPDGHGIRPAQDDFIPALELLPVTCINDFVFFPAVGDLVHVPSHPLFLSSIVLALDMI